jgi:hypothetical protein
VLDFKDKEGISNKPKRGQDEKKSGLNLEGFFM